MGRLEDGAGDCHDEGASCVIEELALRVFTAESPPEQWTEFLGALARHCGATGAAIVNHELSSGAGRILSSTGISGEHARAYRTYFGSSETRALPNRIDISPGRIVPIRTLVPQEIFEATDFYGEFLAPQRMHHVLVGVIENDRGSVTAIAAGRPENAGDFDERHREMISRLLPHLRCALRMSKAAAAMRSRVGMLEGILDQFHAGIVVLGSDGEVLLANRASQSILAENDGLCLKRGGGVAAEKSEESTMLRSLVSQAVSAGGGDRSAGTSAMSITRGRGRCRLMVIVRALQGIGDSEADHRGCALLVVIDPDAAIEICQQSLRRLYGLTQAEAKLAATLAGGRTLKDATSELRIGIPTARTQLARVFLKTNTRRQADLIRLLATCSSLLRAR